jgi:hypothetical protein
MEATLKTGDLVRFIDMYERTHAEAIIVKRLTEADFVTHRFA